MNRYIYEIGLISWSKITEDRENFFGDFVRIVFKTGLLEKNSLSRENMYDQEKHDRRSIRLKGKDYTKPKNYFFTLCVHSRKQLFGSIYKGRMILNDLGEIAHKEWEKTSKIHRSIKPDEFIVMPNHFHGIITIEEHLAMDTRHRTSARGAFGKATSNFIKTIIQSYKQAVTRQINQITKRPGTKIWQRNYYERIMRSPVELEAFRKYIRDNPRNWWKDTLNA